MSEGIIKVFQADFDRFWGLLEKQIEVCPDELWNRKDCDDPFWQQLFHTFACVEIYALEDGESSKQTLYPEAVAMLAAAPEKALGKQEVLAFAAEMKKLADGYISRQTVADLDKRHERMSRMLGRDMTRLNALISLIRHACYHLGCCDAVLRANGVPGVY